MRIRASSRLAYGGEMTQAFRDCCREMARSNDLGKIVRFAMRSGTDWIATTVRERG